MMGRLLIDDDLAIDILDILIEDGREYLASQLLVLMRDTLTEEAFNEYAFLLDE